MGLLLTEILLSALVLTFSRFAWGYFATVNSNRDNISAHVCSLCRRIFDKSDVELWLLKLVIF